MRVLILLLFVLLTNRLVGQVSPKPTYTLTSRLHYGFIWDYSTYVSHLSQQHLPAIEINLTRQTKGSKLWQQEYNYPQVGYSLYYFVFDPAKPVGNALVLMTHAGKNIFKTKRSNMQWRLGFGPTYIERRYDLKENPKNNMISQRINFSMSGQVNYNFRISNKVLFNLGLGIVHISNGALKRPNFGVNLPTIHAGVGINVAKGDDEYRRDSVQSFKRKTYFHISPFIGLKEVYPVNGPKYFLGGINAYIERRMNRKSGLNAGIDLSYDYSKKSEIITDTVNVGNIFINHCQASVIAGHELYINKLSLLTQIGVYVYDPIHLYKPFYNKVGFKYYISDKVYVGMIMKIHLGIADWIEWGGGIRL